MVGHFQRAAIATIVAGILLSQPLPAPALSAQLGLHLKSCAVGKSKKPAECGTFGVYENRAMRSGKVIALAVTILRAKHPSHKAIALIAGGPGQSVREFAEPVADRQFFTDLGQLNDTYDIIFMDDRGMGDSNPLQCDLTPQSDPKVYFASDIPEKQVRVCHTALAARNDLSQYNTNATVDDLDDLRAALGYPALVLEGGSYGTFFEMVYIRRHPEHVTAAVLDSVSAPGFQPLPGEPIGAEEALEDLFAKCARDKVCSRNYRHFAEHFDALVQRLNKAPLPITLHRKGEPDVRVALSKEVFADRMREALYDPDGASYIPFVVESAYRGKTEPLAHFIDLVSTFFSGDQSNGAWLSYTCADWIPFVGDEAVRDAAAHSFTSDLRIRAQRRACSIWNVPAMPDSFNEPVHSQVPILMIGGSDDPGTPVRYAQAAVRYLPNAKLAIVRGAGHSFFNACTDTLVVRFVKAGAAKDLDPNQCRAAFTPPSFATSLAGLP